VQSIDLVLYSHRFINPAVVSPETIDIEIPVENGMVMRRGLMLIGKILQNLANNILFGKEAHMTPLNKFLEGQIANVSRFLNEIYVSFVNGNSFSVSLFISM